MKRNINKYVALLNQNRIKKDFIAELIEVLRKKENGEPKLKQVGSMLYTIGFSDITHDWCVEELINNNSFSEAAKALIDKCVHMIDRFGFLEVIKFLYALRNGTKRIRMHKDVYQDPIQATFWKEHPDGQEYEAHEKNLSRAHFRWNYGKRYTLSDVEVQKINSFIDGICNFTPNFRDITTQSIYDMKNHYIK